MGILDDAMALRQQALDAIVQDNPVSQDYVEFHYSTGRDIGPTFPQVDYTFFKPPINEHSWQDLGKYPAKDEFAGRVVLKRSAKVTDFLSSWQTGMGLIMSARAQAVFCRFNLGMHRVYPINCEHRAGEAPFFFIAIDNPLKDRIDYKRSLFYAANNLASHMYDVAFKSAAEYYQRFAEVSSPAKYRKEGYREGLVESDIEPKRVHVREEHQHIDVLDWYGRFHISKRLAEAITETGLTGVELRESRKVFGANSP